VAVVDPLDPGTNAHNFTLIKPPVSDSINSQLTVEETVSPPRDSKTEVNIDKDFKKLNTFNYFLS
jgi:hypothetical protein